MREVTLEKKVWKGSPVAGMNVGQIKNQFDVSILKVSRGEDSRNPNPNIEINEEDFIFISGKRENVINFIRFAGSDK